MSAIRLGAVSYVNTKPLVHGLDARQDLFTLRFDVPAHCAALLHEGRTDVGLIPAIEYLRGDYRIVPGVAIGSDGPVASVALFSRVAVHEITTLAMDISSRTSVALTRILCARLWKISPKLTTAEPDLKAMLARADAALIIGDPALTLDVERHSVTKIDLGEAWKTLTGLPFVYAMWCGRPESCGPQHVEELNAARHRGEAAVADIARVHGAGDRHREQLICRYLSDNLRYGLREREIAGLRRFHEMAAEQGLVPGLRDLRFF